MCCSRVFLTGLLLCSCSLVFGSSGFTLPESFLGGWKGAPEFSVFGPYAPQPALYRLSISKSPAGDYLLENNIYYDDMASMGYQRFYVEGSGETAGSLWYCGKLTNFSNFEEVTGDERLNGFKALYFPSPSDSKVTFCLDSDNPQVMGYSNPFMQGCSHCDCANWTMVYDPESDSLISQLSMSGSDGHTHSKHVWITMQRNGPAPEISDDDMPGHGNEFSCEFEDGGRDSEPVDRSLQGGCPHMRARYDATKSKRQGLRQTEPYEPYEHCYVINNHSDFRVAWTLDADNSLLHVALSASPSSENLVNDTYVAIGFRPMSRVPSVELTAQGTGRHMNFGMKGADIVAGSLNGGIRTLYAELYTGPPISDDSLKITNEKVKFENGRVVVSFSRPLVSGFLYENFGNEASIVSDAADVIWAIGLDSAAPNSKGNGDEENESGCEYHNNFRGLRFIDWANPTIAMYDIWKC